MINPPRNFTINPLLSSPSLLNRPPPYNSPPFFQGKKVNKPSFSIKTPPTPNYSSLTNKWETVLINRDCKTSCGLIWDGLFTKVQIQFDPQLLACEQALRGALAVGWEKEGKLTTMSQEFEIHLQFPCSSPLTELSDFRQSAQSGNERECKQTWAKGNGVITNVISANQHFTSAFLMGIFKFERHCCKLFFPFPPCRQSVTESLLAGYSAAWPPAFLFLSFSTLCSSSLKRTDIIVPS